MLTPETQTPSHKQFFTPHNSDTGTRLHQTVFSLVFFDSPRNAVARNLAVPGVRQKARNVRHLLGGSTRKTQKTQAKPGQANKQNPRQKTRYTGVVNDPLVICILSSMGHFQITGKSHLLLKMPLKLWSEADF